MWCPGGCDDSQCQEEPPSCTQENLCRNGNVWRYDSCEGWLYEVQKCDSVSCSAWVCNAAKTAKQRTCTGSCQNGQCTGSSTETVNCPFGCLNGKCQPKADFSVSPPALVPGSTVLLDASLSMDPYGLSCGGSACLSYEWFYNGVFAGNSKTFNLTLLPGSQQSIRLKVVTVGLTGETRLPDNGTTHELTRSRNTVINAPDSCTLPCNITINAVGTTDDKFASNQLSYRWDYDGDGVVDATFNSDVLPGAYTYANPGSFTIKLSVVNPDGVESFAEKNIQVINNPPIVDFDMIPSPPTGFIPLTIKFVNKTVDPDGHAISSYFWSFGDGQTSSQESPTHQYSIEGEYTVTLTATDQFGASGSKDKLVIAKQQPLISGLKATNPSDPSKTALITVNCTKTGMPTKIEIFDKDNKLLHSLSGICGNTITAPLLPSGVYLVKAMIVNASGNQHPDCTNCPKTTNITVGMLAPEMQTPEIPAILTAIIALAVVLITGRKKHKG
ncbi:MAG: PKD domain-containing protein [Candidatus Diapherotrites archaeon]